MLAYLESYCWRLFPPTSIEVALKQVLAPSMIRQIRQQEPEQAKWVDILCEVEGYNKVALLQEVASRMSLPAAAVLHIPSSRLVGLTGYTAEHLREWGAVPQSSKSHPGRWNLVVADPTTVAVKEFQNRGVAVELSSRGEIELLWEQFFAMRNAQQTKMLSDKQLNVVLTQLVRDAVRCGATEVFIGHPVSGAYEFVTEERKFAGTLHPSVYDTILELLSQKTSIVRELDAEEKCIQLALTKNFTKPVIYMSWETTVANSHQTTYSARGVSDQHVTIDFELDCEPREVNGARSRGEVQSNERKMIHDEPVVLLIDDDLEFAELLRRVLTRNKYRVLVRTDSTEAVEEIVRGTICPAIVVLDLRMPTLGGAQVVECLRDMNADVPVLMLTSDTDMEEETRLISLGASAFVRKGQDVRILLAWIENILRRATSGGEPGQDTEMSR